MESWVARIIPWVATVGCLIEFVVVDELKGGRARLAAAAGAGLMAASVAVGTLTSASVADLTCAAAPPLLFLLFATVSRAGFRWLVRREPRVLLTANDYRDARDAPHGRGLAWDGAYTAVIGVGWLLALLPAITRLR